VLFFFLYSSLFFVSKKKKSVPYHNSFTFQEVPDFSSQFTSINLVESKPLKGLKVGLIRETLEDGVDNGVKSAISGAASHLEELGCTETEV
jgi:aspartyl-tRNA(Asn)/glutamyl-tRNA(Gln) amidotransferase subunit A